MQQDYKNEILPLFRRRYTATDLPTGLEVWEGGQVDGGAFDKTVFVYEGVYSLSRPLRLWALAHETGHVVTVNEANKIGCGAAIPAPGEYKKSEYLADLIATHIIFEGNPSLGESVKGLLTTLATELGGADSMHPSGADRTGVIGEYLAARGEHRAGDETLWNNAFAPLFRRVWNAAATPYNGK